MYPLVVVKLKRGASFFVDCKPMLFHTTELSAIEKNGVLSGSSPVRDFSSVLSLSSQELGLEIRR
jgi:hypothetical protein